MPNNPAPQQSVNLLNTNQSSSIPNQNNSFNNHVPPVVNRVSNVPILTNNNNHNQSKYPNNSNIHSNNNNKIPTIPVNIPDSNQIAPRVAMAARTDTRRVQFQPHRFDHVYSPSHSIYKHQTQIVQTTNIIQTPPVQLPISNQHIHSGRSRRSSINIGTQDSRSRENQTSGFLSNNQIPIWGIIVLIISNDVRSTIFL
eukprot:UN31567